MGGFDPWGEVELGRERKCIKCPLLPPLDLKCTFTLLDLSLSENFHLFLSPLLGSISRSSKFGGWGEERRVEHGG